MMTEGTNLLVLTFPAFWSSSMWPLATWMSSRRQRSIPLCGRYRQVSLYFIKSTCFFVVMLLVSMDLIGFNLTIKQWVINKPIFARSKFKMHCRRISAIAKGPRWSLISLSVVDIIFCLCFLLLYEIPDGMIQCDVCQNAIVCNMLNEA